MYQWGLILILLLSFGVIELLAGDGKETGPMAARWNLTAWAPLRRLLASTAAVQVVVDVDPESVI